MKERIETMISAEAIGKRLDEMAKEIGAEFKGEPVELICVLKGSVVTLVEIAKRLPMAVTMNFMDVSSYGDGTESSGKIKINMDLDVDIAGKNVLLVEDIIDSGRTLSHLSKLLLERNPKKFKIMTFLDKPDRRVAEVPVDYIGFTIPDAFVVGYGLDYAQKYRNLNFVGILHFDEE